MSSRHQAQAFAVRRARTAKTILLTAVSRWVNSRSIASGQTWFVLQVLVALVRTEDKKTAGRTRFLGDTFGDTLFGFLRPVHAIMCNTDDTRIY